MDTHGKFIQHCLNPVWLIVPSLTADAMGVVVNQDVYNVHDVTGTMKQFFRNLPDPLLTHQLYEQFIEAAREWSRRGSWVGIGWMYECGVESRGWGVKDGVGGWVVRDWIGGGRRDGLDGGAVLTARVESRISWRANVTG